MNPVVRYIFAALESNNKSLDRISRNLRGQSVVNKELRCAILLLSVVTAYELYESNKRDAKIHDLETRLEELKPKED